MSSCEIRVKYIVDQVRDIRILRFQRIENDMVIREASIKSIVSRRPPEKFILLFQEVSGRSKTLSCERFYNVLLETFDKLLDEIVYEMLKGEPYYTLVNELAITVSEMEEFILEKFEDLIKYIYSNLDKKILEYREIRDLHNIMANEFLSLISKLSKVVIVEYTFNRRGFMIFLPIEEGRIAVDKQYLSSNPKYAQKILDVILNYRILEIDPGAKKDLLETLFFYSWM